MGLSYVIDGNNTPIEGDKMAEPYENVRSAAYPVYEDIDSVLYGGTDHDIDKNTFATSLSYKLNEDISFVFHLKGDYKLIWQVDKDNAIGNLYGKETASGTVVAGGTHDPKIDGYFFNYTTQMKHAGVVRFTGTLVNGETGKAVKKFYVSAVADYTNITQSLEKGLNDEEVTALVNTTKDYFNTWAATWDNQANIVCSVVAANTELATWLADTTKTTTENSEYTIDGLLKLKVAATGGEGDTAWTSYYFWIATGSAGLNTEADQNERPATGVFAVRNTASDLNISAQFMAWDNNSAMSTDAPGATTLGVRVLNHGKEINVNMTGLDTAATSNDPTELFAYGVLKRDYIALQVAKTLFKDKLAENLSISANGGSAGGWQAISIAALDEAVNTVSTRITWLCSLGADAAGDIVSGFHPINCEGTRVFSTVTAARVINDRVADSGKPFKLNIFDARLGDYQASPPHGIIALYNAFTDKNVEKSATFTQYSEHGLVVCGSSTTFKAILIN